MSFSDTAAKLRGRRILVVEDEMLIAMMILSMLEDVGCMPIGPARRVVEALALVEAGPLDAALLDVNIDGEKVYPVAQQLAARGVPFLFLTGYGAAIIEDPHRNRPVLSKPFTAAAVTAALAACLDAGRALTVPSD